VATSVLSPQDVFADSSPYMGVALSDAEAFAVAAPRPPAKRAKRLGADKLHRVQYKLKAASYNVGGMDWERLFAQYDTDCSGTLEVVRRVEYRSRVGSFCRSVVLSRCLSASLHLCLSVAQSRSVALPRCRSVSLCLCVARGSVVVACCFFCRRFVAIHERQRARVNPARRLEPRGARACLSRRLGIAAQSSEGSEAEWMNVNVRPPRGGA
jgi:hypothetical protein